MYVGLDIGGTKILGGLVDNNKKIINLYKLKTQAEQGSDYVLNRVKEVISKVSEGYSIEGIGIGIPGSIDVNEGIVLISPNLPFENLSLKNELEKVFHVPIEIDNDVNVGLLGEFWAGEGQGYQNLAGIFIGTGIGGAIIIDNKLRHGLHNIAGEVGHMKLKIKGSECNCGQSGCLESLGSKIAMKRYLKKQGMEVDFLLKSSFLKNRLNDKRVAECLQKASFFIGEAIGNIVNIIDPEVIILGGGVVEAVGDYMLKKIEAAAAKRAMTIPNIKISSLGDHSLIMGAVGLVKLSNHQLQAGLV